MPNLFGHAHIQILKKCIYLPIPIHLAKPIHCCSCSLFAMLYNILMRETSDNTPSDPISPRDPTAFPSLESVISSLQSSAENHLKVLSLYGYYSFLIV